MQTTKQEIAEKLNDKKKENERNLFLVGEYFDAAMINKFKKISECLYI